MGRLTGRNQYRIPFISGVDTSNLIRHLGNRDSVLLRDAIDRLAAYEDTWMTPEEFHAYWVFFEDLIGNQKASEALDYFRHILNAERAGRLVVLPDGDDTAALAATIDSIGMIRAWCGGDSDLLMGLLSMLVSEVAKKAGTTYRTLLITMAKRSPIGDRFKEKRTEEERQ